MTGQGGKGEPGGKGSQGGQGDQGGKAGKAGALSAEALQALGKVPDFRLRIRWRFGGLGPIGWAVKKYFPSDNYEVYKCGERLRIDGTPLGHHAPAIHVRHVCV